MSKDQSYGIIILVISVIGIFVYAWLLYAYAVIVLQVTAFIAISGILAIAAWIGYTMATTPPPVPLETEPLTPQTQTDATNNYAQ